MTRTDTKFIKAVAVSMMVIHHLFGFPERTSNVTYFTFFPNFIINMALSFKLCVCIFLFLMGYGAFYTLKKGRFQSIIRMKEFFYNYWLIFFIFINFGLIIGVYQFNLDQYINGLLGLTYLYQGLSYNGEWWFIFVYIVFSLTFFLIYKQVTTKSGFIIVALYLITLYIIQNYLLVNGFWQPSPTISILFSRVYFISFWYSCCIIGYYFAYFDIFSKIKTSFKGKYLVGISLFILVCYIRYLLKDVYIFDFILAPFIVYAIILLRSKTLLDKVLLVIGNHSTNIWLVHTFFAYYFFQRMSFILVWAPLVFITVMGYSIITSLFINRIYQLVKKLENKIITFKTQSVGLNN